MSAIQKSIARVQVYIIAVLSIFLATTMDSRASMVSYNYIGGTSEFCLMGGGFFDCHAEGMFTVQDNMPGVIQVPTGIMFELVRDSDSAILDSYSGPWFEATAELDAAQIFFQVTFSEPSLDLSFGLLGWSWNPGGLSGAVLASGIGALVTPKAVPLPAALPLFAGGLGLLGLLGWRRKRMAAA